MLLRGGVLVLFIAGSDITRGVLIVLSDILGDGDGDNTRGQNVGMILENVYL